MKKFIILVMLIFLLQEGKSQSLGIGMGVTSHGDIPVLLDVTFNKIGIYLGYMSEDDDIIGEEIINTKYWHNEYIIGCTYRVFDDYPFRILGGVGTNSTTEKSSIISKKETNGFSYEVGFSIQPIKKCNWLELRTTLGNYTQMKTVIVLKYNFKR